MKRVFKYNLVASDHQVIELPKGAQILTVNNQYDHMVLYAEVDDTNVELKPIDIYIYGTGAPMDRRATLYLGTVLMFYGDAVFHIYANEDQFYNDAPMPVRHRVRD